MTDSAPDLVYLCDWLPPDFGAVGQYTIQHARQRARLGEAVTVYGLSSTTESVDIEYCDSGRVKVIRLFAPIYDRSSFRHRAWWTLTINLKLVRRALSDMRRANTVAFTGSPPFLLHLMAPLNVLLGKKLVYRISDFFPECLLAQQSRPHLVLRLLHRLTVFWRKRVFVLEVLGEDQRNRLRELGIPDDRIVLRRDTSPVPITAETKPLPHPAALAGKKVLLYSGNFGVAHDFETFLAGYLKHHREGSGRVALWLNAQGAGADTLENRLRAEGLPIHRSRPVPLDQLASLLVTPDAHLITLRNEFMGYVLPSKVYGCIESGKAILYAGPKGSDVHLLCQAKTTPGRYFQADIGDIDAVFGALQALGEEEASATTEIFKAGVPVEEGNAVDSAQKGMQ